MATRHTLIAFFCMTAYACSPSEEQANQVTSYGQAAKTEIKPTKQATIEGSRIKGKIVETIEAGAYTYVSVELTTGGRVWLAGPSTVVKVGSSIDVDKGMEMKDFKSKSLNKTFGSIHFVSSLGAPPTTRSGGNPSSQPASAPVYGSAEPKAAPVTPKAQPAPIKVDRAPGGKTISEVFSEAEQLSGKEVLIKARVVKFSAAIMNRNWLHLQDGTGSAASRTHDLTVTTSDTVTVGQTVTVRGKVTVNKDFGAGYSYPVILEEASIEPAD